MTCAASPAPSIKAVELGERYKPDLAVLDIRLAEGGLGTEIPHRLRMPTTWAFSMLGPCTAAADEGGWQRGDHEPYRPEDILRALGIVEEVVETGAASQPFPEKFILLNGSPAPMPAMTAADFKEVQRLLRQQAALLEFGRMRSPATDVQSVLKEAARVCAEGRTSSSAKFPGIAPKRMIFLSRRGSVGMPG